MRIFLRRILLLLKISKRMVFKFSNEILFIKYRFYIQILRRKYRELAGNMACHRQNKF